ncbi:hypothetical protein ACFFOP_02870 [Sinosporangium siamense]|uniref:hypothetical protein n=1 Tax=Sinosporangium siamense TaxID=1367973 RepID=UPI0035ECD4BD
MGSPVEIAAMNLVFYILEVGTTSINHLRMWSTQKELPSCDVSGDELLDAVVQLAVESYGELLLPTLEYWSSRG